MILSPAVLYLEEQFEIEKHIRQYDRESVYVRPMFQILNDSSKLVDWASGDDAYVCRFGNYNIEEIVEELVEEVAA